MIKIEQKDTFEIKKRAVDKAVNLIKPTYGPASNKVIISKVLNKIVVDDGVQIARDLEFDDPSENAVLNIVRETAIKTNDRVGDGTAGSLIMLQAIINEVAKLSRIDGRKIEKELRVGFEEVKKNLIGMAKQIKSREDLVKVARISFDNKIIAEVIADAWWKLGADGVVTVDRSGTMETCADISSGIKINRGYISPYMITNPSRMEAVIEKPYIFVTDYRLVEVDDVLAAMNLLVTKKIFNLIIICDNIEQNALATAIINKIQGKFNLVAVNKPVGGDETTHLEDIATMIGAKFFSQKKGDKLAEIKIEDFGHAERFIAKEKESTIIGPKGDKKVIASATADLQMFLTSAEMEKDKDRIKERMARFTGKVAVIKVGAATENEVNALKYKVDDAVNAVQAAFRGGVVCGAGLSLSRIKTSSEILNEALKAPYKQLKDNMGMEKDLVDYTKGDEAMNVVTGEVGNFFKVGVLDPVDVLIAGVESAISIASLLITTTGMIVEKPRKPRIEEE